MPRGIKSAPPAGPASVKKTPPRRSAKSAAKAASPSPQGQDPFTAPTQDDFDSGQSDVGHEGRAHSSSQQDASKASMPYGLPGLSPVDFVNQLGVMFGAPIFTSPSGATPESAATGFDPTFGFAGIMPAAIAQMRETFARLPGMDWLNRFNFGVSAPLHIDAQKLGDLQNEYSQRAQQLMQLAASGEPPELKDRRFTDDSWQGQNQPWGWTAALYLLNSEFLRRTAALLEGEPKTVERVCFAVGQWCDALAPSNFLATNPEAQRRIIDTKGESLRLGIDNLLSDLQKGRISMTDEQAFEVGRNVATTPGAVVFQNELFQLIQYGAVTDRVGERPLLFVPPCINKYYILDLQPDNSLVAYALAKGHTVFVVSWVNPGPELGHLRWDDYLGQGVHEAIRVTREICKVDQINALGFCVGGTLLGCALAVLAARGEKPVASLTLMSTFLDFGDPGVLGVFIDEAVVAFREQQMGQGGIMSGRDLSSTFSFLRPNDLVWNYVVGNYLKGEEPPPFDLLFWNGDITNLPGPMYSFYLRHMYLRNELCKPGVLHCLGEALDLGQLTMPAYLFAAREDHIVPWKAAYGSTQLLGGEMRFVLGASGHIAGAINAAGKNKRSYWSGALQAARNEGYSSDPEQWLAQSTEQAGSWWIDWASWLERYKGPTRAARGLGSEIFEVIEPAPGSYVRRRAEA